MDTKLSHLVDAAWQGFDSARGDFVVRPAMPILYFGDRPALLKSSLRVITVGLNPSCAEFPEEDRFSRFPTASSLAEPVGNATAERTAYVGALDQYFNVRPYKRWFDGSFSAILEGLGASYYGGPIVAIHTDICSPIATKPTWSGLGKDPRKSLADWGVGLWHDLIGHLKPDVAIMSVAAQHLTAITFPQVTPWDGIFSIDRARSYIVKGAFFDIGAGKRCFFVFGQAAQLPFGTVGSKDKRRMGEAILEALRG